MHQVSQNNNNTKEAEFQHLNFNERKIIERLLKEKCTQAHISRVLCRSKSTISREITRGSVEQRKNISSRSKKIDIPLEITYKKYFADVGEHKYQENRQRCGAKCKVVQCINMLEFIENKVLSKEKWSPDAALGYAKANGLFKTSITTKTFYNWIDAGLTKVKSIDLLLRVRRKPKSKTKERKRILGKSIEERPKKVDERIEFGNWEGDGIVGKNHQGHLITLVERKTGLGLIFNVIDRKDDKIVNVLDCLEEKFGKHFSKIFKTITFDNGSEFARSDLMEQNNRTQIYYAHPYSSWERATNENWNGIVRRFIPKGSSFQMLTFEQLERINMWINTLPRKRFGYKTPFDLFEQEINAIISA
jgi:IS30 family transposase